MELKKNDFYNVKINDISTNGEGIGKINNFTVFVKNALPEEIVKIKLIKLKKNYGYGKLIEILSVSPFRENPPCKYYGKCGGCNLQNLNYEQQLNLKTKLVKDTLLRIGKLKDIKVLKTLGMKNPLNYRNKAQIPINSKDGEVNIGFFMERSHNIINIENCVIQDKINKKVIEILREFIQENNIEVYNEKEHKGLIRHIVTRTSKSINELIVCLVINSNNKFKYKNQLIEKFKNIENLKGIILSFNTNKTNVILGEKLEVIYGRDYIIDYIDKLKFKISISSFYQVNPLQTQILYKKCLEFADLKGQEVVIDAYCGIGTISLFLAKNAKKVYGIEIVEKAIKDATFNAKENNIKNTEFLIGKTEEILPNLINKEYIHPDILILDPPRKGCEKSLLNTIVNSNIKKIVYISCNPSTLARDLNYLCENNYRLEKVQPIDMFCHSTHIETVCMLIKNNHSSL